jgi:hypothetical protein
MHRLAKLKVKLSCVSTKYSCYGKLIQSWRFVAHYTVCTNLLLLFTNDIIAPLTHTPEMGKCWGGQGSSGAVPLNLVGNEYKDKQCVMRYEMPRLNKFSVTAVSS